MSPRLSSRRGLARRLPGGLLGLALVTLAACAPVTAVVRHPAPPRPATHPSAVRIYLHPSGAPPRYEELGFIVANTHTFLPVMLNLDTAIAERAQHVRAGNLSNHPVLWALVGRAAALGADGVVITGMFRAGTTFSLSGVAIRAAPPGCAAPVGSAPPGVPGPRPAVPGPPPPAP